MKNSILFLIIISLSIFCKNFQAFSQGLIIQSGAKVVMSANPSLVIKDASFQNDGDFTSDNSKVIIKGTSTSANSQIKGTSTTVFYDLEINKSSNDSELGNNIEINHQLILSNGNLNLQGNQITLNTNGELSGMSESSRIYCTIGGTVVKVVEMNAPNALNVGNLGAIITSSQDMGNTTITLGFVARTSPSGYGINRYYVIQPEHNANLDATLVFNYLDAELNGINESELDVWRFNGTDWDSQSATLNTTNNTLTKSNIPAFSTWTAGSPFNNPLPVTLTRFEAQRLNDFEVKLSWTTASEWHNKGFAIEKSSDGFLFDSLGFVTGAGDSQVAHNYEFILQETEPSYYRLKQLDFEGTFEYSEVRYVAGNEAILQLMVYPNPSKGEVNIRFSKKVSAFTLKMIGLDGKIALYETFENEFQAETTLNHLLTQQPNGTYYLVFQSVDWQFTMPLILMR